jgi:hypothetical protein
MPNNRRGLDPRQSASQAVAVAGFIHHGQFIGVCRGQVRHEPRAQTHESGERPKAYRPRRYFSQGVPFRAVFKPRPVAPIC